METTKILRLIDANLNRLREGLRLLEDVARYVFDNKKLSKEFKHMRHSLQNFYSLDRVQHRDIINDVSRGTIESELKRDSCLNLIIANFLRVEESSRVLEETFKLVEPQNSNFFKELRYKVYDLEKYFLDLATTNRTSNSK